LRVDAILAEHFRVAIAELPRELGRLLDIREEKGDRPARKVTHGGSMVAPGALFGKEHPKKGTDPIRGLSLVFRTAHNPGMEALTRDLLSWIATTPRTYRETMDAWRTSCPRLSIWEDAVGVGLVRIRESRVELTPRGEAVLDGVRTRQSG
jgi:hypothetical protein